MKTDGIVFLQGLRRQDAIGIENGKSQYVLVNE